MPVPSPFHPASQQAQDIYGLFLIVLAILLLILLVVAGLVIYIAVRYRRRPGDALPRQDFGNPRLETLWTVIPFLIVTVMFVMTVQTMRAVDPHPLNRNPDLQITAHQWWWEFRYPDSGVVTANELHIPVGKNLYYRLTSADVIHRFSGCPSSGRRSMPFRSIRTLPGFRPMLPAPILVPAPNTAERNTPGCGSGSSPRARRISLPGPSTSRSSRRLRNPAKPSPAGGSSRGSPA